MRKVLWLMVKTGVLVDIKVQSTLSVAVAMLTEGECYIVGLICALPIRYTITRALLEEEHTRDKVSNINTRSGHNGYTFSRPHEYNIVISCLLHG